MTTRHDRTGATPGGRPNFGNRRRLKDTLMPDEPPKMLGLAIPVVAALLIVLFVTLRLVEHHDVVRVNLTVKRSESFGRAYGEAYLQQGEATAVRAEQIVDIDLGGHGGTKRHRQQGKVSEVSAFDIPSFYRVRVDLPPEFDVNS